LLHHFLPRVNPWARSRRTKEGFGVTSMSFVYAIFPSESTKLIRRTLGGSGGGGKISSSNRSIRVRILMRRNLVSAAFLLFENPKLGAPVRQRQAQTGASPLRWQRFPADSVRSPFTRRLPRAPAQLRRMGRRLPGRPACRCIPGSAARCSLRISGRSP
jgi:hypothetical protein